MSAISTPLKNENDILKQIFNNDEKKPVKKSSRFIREMLAVIIWLYFVIKLFIFDIDVYLMEFLFPRYVYLVDYKFVFIIALISFVWLFTKNKNIFIWSIYIIGYPFVFVFWKLPRCIFKQQSWLLAVALINTVISFFVSLKYSLIVMSLFLLSLLAILNLSNKTLIGIATLTLALLLIVTYFRRVINVFKQSNVYQFYMKFLSGLRRNDFSTLELEESIRFLPIEQLSEKQLESRTTKLQNSVLFNRMYLFIGIKLKNYQQSSWNFISYVLTILIFIVNTVVSFTFINLGIYKIDPNQFSYDSSPTFFTFFYYSFNSLLATPISEIKPISTLAQTISMAGTISSFFIAVIFVALIFSVGSKKHEKELEVVIDGFKEQGSALEKFIKEEYKINSIEEALVELETVKAAFIRFLYKMSESIK